jgi:hypothetical protein
MREMLHGITSIIILTKISINSITITFFSFTKCLCNKCNMKPPCGEFVVTWNVIITIVQASINIVIMWKLLLTFVTLLLCKTSINFVIIWNFVNICMQKHLLFLFLCNILLLFILTSKLHHHSQVMLAPLLLFYLLCY